VVQKDVSILLSLSFHIKLTQARVFQVNQSWSFKALFPSFNESSSKIFRAGEIEEAYFAMKLVVQLTGDLGGTFQAETLLPDSQ